MGREVANEIGMGSGFHEGVYTMLGGPNFGKYDIGISGSNEFEGCNLLESKIFEYPFNHSLTKDDYRQGICNQIHLCYILETVAELRMLKTCGVDAVGRLLKSFRSISCVLVTFEYTVTYIIRGKNTSALLNLHVVTYIRRSVQLKLN